MTDATPAALPSVRTNLALATRALWADACFHVGFAAIVGVLDAVFYTQLTSRESPGDVANVFA